MLGAMGIRTYADGYLTNWSREIKLNNNTSPRVPSILPTRGPVPNNPPSWWLPRECYCTVHPEFLVYESNFPLVDIGILLAVEFSECKKASNHTLVCWAGRSAGLVAQGPSHLNETGNFHFFTDISATSILFLIVMIQWCAVLYYFGVFTSSWAGWKTDQEIRNRTSGTVEFVLGNGV
jgi:hypothetical protein